MAYDNRIRDIISIGDGCLGEDFEPKRYYTSPKSPTNLKYARSHAELAGRKEPSLKQGVSFTEELECEDYCCWE